MEVCDIGCYSETCPLLEQNLILIFFFFFISFITNTKFIFLLQHTLLSLEQMYVIALSKYK